MWLLQREPTLAQRVAFYRELRAIVKGGPYAWPGGYPIYFACADGGALSHEAVVENWKNIRSSIVRDDDPQWYVIAAGVNWEDPDLYCSHTCKRIESAYAEPDDSPEGTPEEGVEHDAVRV
jgi:hypothetical protein